MEAVYVVTHGKRGGHDGDYTRPVGFLSLDFADEEARRFMHESNHVGWERFPHEERHDHVVRAWCTDRLSASGPGHVVWVERLAVEA